MIKPVRLQLSRRKGFDLQALSMATNGLPAVNAGRPSRWGNPVTKRDFEELQRILSAAGQEPISGTWQEHAVKCYDAWIGGGIPELGTPPTCEEIVDELRGKNLGCWCGANDPCHVDILLALANSGEGEPWHS